MISPRLRFIAAHQTELMYVMSHDRAYKNLLKMAETYEKQILSVLKLHTKVPDPLDLDGLVCTEDGDTWPCATRRIFE